LIIHVINPEVDVTPTFEFLDTCPYFFSGVALKIGNNFVLGHGFLHKI
jgi:hypothetical protein